MKQASVDAKATSAHQGKPPMTSGAAGADAGLNSLTNKQQPSKWAINIQEIVKRTQKNLERGPSSQKASQGDARKPGAVGSEIQYLTKHLKSGFGSSSTKDKSSLLYHDLKKKLTYDSGPQQDLGSAGFRGKHENLLNFHGALNNTGGTLNSAKSMRPTSLNAQSSSTTAQIAQKSLYLANQKSALQDRLAIARLKRKNTQGDQADGQLHDRAGHHSANDISQLSSSFQGGQGGGAQGIGSETFQPYGSGNVVLSSQRTQTRHGGRQNLLRAQQEDEQAQIITTGMNQRLQSRAKAETQQPIAFRRHNSNLQREPDNFQNLIAEGQATLMDENAGDCVVEEVGTSEEQTRRGDANSRAGRQSSMDRIQMQGTHNTDDMIQPKLLTANGAFLPEPEQQSTHTGKIAMSATGQTGAQLPGSFTEQPGKRQTDMKGKSMQSVEHRQKIFEEEIIKRVKEIQRYVKSLHLQVKKTQGGVDKIRDEVDSDKDVLLSVQQRVESQGKKWQAERLKTVTSADMEVHLKEFESRYNEKLVLVVQEAVDQTLKQVSDNLIPDTRLKMYDSITEETSQVKSEFQFEMQTLKREFQDQSKQERLKAKERFDTDTKLLRKELAAEQTARDLQLMSQVDAQIAKALSDARQIDHMPRTEIQNLRVETIERIRTVQTQVSEDVRDELLKEMLKEKEKSADELQRGLQGVESRLQDRLLASVAHSRESQHVLEQVETRIAQCHSDLMKAAKSEITKASEFSQAAFVSSDKLHAELAKLKKELSKQITTNSEEAKFDTIQMVQTDLHTVAAAQKEATFKLQELANTSEEGKSDLSKLSSKLQNQLKENGLKVNAVETNFMKMKSKIESLESELKQKELQANSSQLPAVSTEELDELRSEIFDIRNSCNLIQASADEAKMAASNSKSSLEKLLKNVRQQVDELSRKVSEDATEFNESRQALEDSLNDLSQAQTVLDENLSSQQKTLSAVQQVLAGVKTEAAKQAKDVGQLSLHLSTFQSEITHKVNEIEVSVPELSPLQIEISSLAQKLAQVEQAGQSEVAKVLKMHKETKMDFEDNFTQLDNQVGALDHWMAKAKEDLIQLKSLPRPSSESPQTSKAAKVTNQQVTELNLRFDQLKEDFSGELARLDRELKTVDKGMDAIKIRADELGLVNDKLRSDLSAVSSHAKTLESRTEKQEESSSRIEIKLTQLTEAIQKPPEVTQAELNALQQKLASSKLEIEEKLSAIALEQEQLRLTQQSSSSQVKHEPGQVHKVEAKRPMSQWTTVKVGKIEPKETALRSSELMVSAAAPSTTQAKQQLQAPFEQPMSLSTLQQEKPLVVGSESPYGLAFDNQVNCLASQSNTDRMKDPTNQSASVELHSQMQKEQLEEDEPQILEIENPVKFEMVGGSESEVKVIDTNSSKQDLNIAKDMAIIGFPDDRTLNEQLISPSDGAQVLDGDFYKLQREISSSYVPKKNEIALSSKHELALESDKADSPSPLAQKPSVDDQSAREQSEQQNSPKQDLDAMAHESSVFEAPDLDKNVTAADLEQKEWQSQSKQISKGSQLFRTQKMAGLTQISQKATQQVAEGLGEADLELHGSPSLQESASQLPDGESLDGCNNFLKNFEANATKHKNGTGLDLMQLNFNDVQNDLPSSRDGHNLEDEFNDILDSANFNRPQERNEGGAIKSARQDSVNRLAMEIDQLQCDDVTLQSNQKSELKLPESFAGDDEEEHGFDDAIPSNAVLNMKLGAHMKKPSDGKSSMMGLSALGLESQRESHASDERESEVLRIVEILVGEEIAEAIDIMQVLGHPQACSSLMQDL